MQGHFLQTTKYWNKPNLSIYCQQFQQDKYKCPVQFVSLVKRVDEMYVHVYCTYTVYFIGSSL